MVCDTADAVQPSADISELSKKGGGRGPHPQQYLVLDQERARQPHPLQHVPHGRGWHEQDDGAGVRPLRHPRQHDGSGPHLHRPYQVPQQDPRREARHDGGGVHGIGQRRYQTPEEYGRMATFLISPANGCMSGQAFIFDGAMTTSY